MKNSTPREREPQNDNLHYIPKPAILGSMISLCFFIGVISHAQQSTWYFDNVTLNTGATARGSFGSSKLPFMLQNVLDDPDNFLNLNTWFINAQLPSTINKALQLRNQFEHSKF